MGKGRNGLYLFPFYIKSLEVLGVTKSIITQMFVLQDHWQHVSGSGEENVSGHPTYL